MYSYRAVRTLKDVHQQRDEIMALAWQYRARQVFVFGSLMRGGLQSESDCNGPIKVDTKIQNLREWYHATAPRILPASGSLEHCVIVGADRLPG